MRGALGLTLMLAGCAGDASSSEASEASSGSRGDSSGEGGEPTTQVEGTSSGGDGESSGGSSGSSDEGGESSTGAADEDCSGEDMQYAPPAVPMGETTLVPVDVLELRGDFVFDYAAQTTVAHAELRFRLGAQAGRPIFDLRQEGPWVASLDGTPLAEDGLPQYDLGGGPGAEMRVLTMTLPACSEHVLILDYPISALSGVSALPPEFKEDGVAWEFGFSDLAPRMFLEQWLPANLVHDRHAIVIGVEVVGGPADQRVISNGAVEQLGDGRWQVELPAFSTAQSPLLVLVPGARIESSSMMLDLPDGSYGVELHRRIEVDVSSAALHELLAASFAEYTASTGTYGYTTFTAVVSFNGGMEYDGATTSSVNALPHELFHSWWGRGVRPARASDGWFDEAWNDYVTAFPKLAATPMDPDTPLTVLHSANPWTRTTPYASYEVGKQVFMAIADAVGVAALQASMREFYQAHPHDLVTTQMLERHLVCSLELPAVRDLFQQYVYGKAEAPAPGEPCP